jgi:hypothetical protein
MPAIRSLIRLAALLVMSAIPLRAQGSAGRLAGTVIDAKTQAPVANADLFFLADGRSVKSDSLGRFAFDKLPKGILKFMVRAPGHPIATVVVALAEGEQLQRDFVIDAPAAGPRSEAAQGLPQVTVKTDPAVLARYADFERRRRTGSGQYLTRADIEAGHFQLVTDAMRGMKGVLLDCGGSQGCQVRMANAPAQCLADFIVDERVDNYFGPKTPINDIEGIEVYNGPAQIPGEFTASTSGCGLVVIWTRSGPPRKAKKKSP